MQEKLLLVALSLSLPACTPVEGRIGSTAPPSASTQSALPSASPESADAGASAAARCRPDAFVSADVAGQAGVIDCGTLDMGTPAFQPAALRTADACAMDAARAKKPFRLVYDARGIDSRLRVGISGADRGSGFQIRSYLYDGNVHGGGGDGDPRLTRHTCTALELAPNCPLGFARSCATCAGNGNDAGEAVCP